MAKTNPGLHRELGCMNQPFTCSVRDDEDHVTWTHVAAEDARSAATTAVARLHLLGRCKVDIYPGKLPTPVDPGKPPVLIATLIG